MSTSSSAATAAAGLANAQARLLPYIQRTDSVVCLGAFRLQQNGQEIEPAISSPSPSAALSAVPPPSASGQVSLLPAIWKIVIVQTDGRARFFATERIGASF